MESGWAVVSAVAAAASYAGGAVVQQRAATAGVRTPGSASTGSASTSPESTSPESTGSAPTGRPVLLAVALRPLWVAGVGLDGLGFLLEFLALRGGSLTLVQPLLVSGLVFALPLGAVLTGLPVRARDAGAAGLIVGGLSVALLAAAPGEGFTPPGTTAWLATLCVVALIVGGLVAVARSTDRPPVQAVSLATAAAAVNGLLSAFGKDLAIRSEHGVLTAVRSWTTLGLVIAAVLTLTLAAAAFRAGAPTVAIGTLFAGEPFFGVTGGVILFGDSTHHSTLVVLATTAGLMTCLLGVSLLAASPTIIATYTTPTHRQPHTRGEGEGEVAAPSGPTPNETTPDIAPAA